MHIWKCNNKLWVVSLVTHYACMIFDWWSVHRSASTSSRPTASTSTARARTSVTKRSAVNFPARRFVSIVWIPQIYLEWYWTYRMVHQIADLAWVDLDLVCSTFLPICSAVSAKVPSVIAKLGRWQTAKIKASQTLIRELIYLHVDLFRMLQQEIFSLLSGQTARVPRFRPLSSSRWRSWSSPWSSPCSSPGICVSVLCYLN